MQTLGRQSILQRSISLPNMSKNRPQSTLSFLKRPANVVRLINDVHVHYPSISDDSIDRILNFAKEQFVRIRSDLLYHIPKEFEGLKHSIFLNSAKSHIFIPLKRTLIAEGSQNKVKECIRIHLDGDKYTVDLVTKTVRCLNTPEDVKKIQSDWREREELRTGMAQHEINILKSLQSKSNILPLLDSCIYQGSVKKKPMGKLVMFTPYFEADLHQAIMENRLGFFTHEEKISIVYQIVCGLVSIHNEKLVHKDIKQENVLIRRTDARDLDAVIADFGHTRFADTPMMKIDGFGTYFAWPPEFVAQLVECECVSLDSHPQVDIWALGVLIHELFLGETEWDSILEFMKDSYLRIIHHLYRIDHNDPCIEDKIKTLQEGQEIMRQKFAVFKKLTLEFEKDEGDGEPVTVFLRRLLCWDPEKRITSMALKELMEKEFEFLKKN